jgi:nucleoside-diphosphate-sugar epimerase
MIDAMHVRSLRGETVAITGVGGFIGLSVAKRLASQGIAVRGLDHSADAVNRARAVGAQASVGDICDAAAVRTLCEGASLVIHTAAVVSEGGDRALFDRVNVGGTRAVLDAAIAANCSLVHLSSVMVYGFSFRDGVDEEGPLRGEDNPYCESKIASESVVLCAAREGRARALVIRPGDVYGVGSVPWVRRPLALMRKGLFVLPDGGRGLINHVHVENLVDAVLLAVERGAWGRAFNVTDGVRTTCAQYFSRLAKLAGIEALRSAPSWLLRPAFAAIARGARLVHVEPPATEDAVSFLLRPGQYSIERARSELGYQPRVTLDQGFEELARSER